MRGSYIVVLKDEAAGRVEALAQQLSRAHGGLVAATYRHALRGFNVRMSEAAAEALARNPAVSYVEEDGLIELASTQTNAPWGLDRIDQSALPLSTTYTYTSTGAGVSVYVIDSGIRTTHQEFGGRASVAYDGVGDGQNGQDCFGHGTRVASIVGGSTYGVAKGALLKAVRVAGCNNSSPVSQIIAGVDWVTANHVSPSAALMGFSGGGNTSLDTAVRGMISSGVTTVVPAGNLNLDAGTRSPSRVTEALTVGAIDQFDTRSVFSNFGSVLDIFAPGVDIPAANWFDDTATIIDSGTSMAAAHAVGVAAAYLETHATASPAQVNQAIIDNSTTGVVNNPGTNSPNRLLHLTEQSQGSSAITATKVDAWDDSLTPDGKAEPGQTITYTVTITNTGDADATGVTFTDSVDGNTSLVPGSTNTQPIAVADSYNVIGNVRIQIPDGANDLLANDRDPDSGTNAGLTASGPTTTTQGGNITINSDGSFSYDPAPGFAGTDMVTYTVTDAGGKTDTAVAYFKVGNGASTPGANVVWFVNPSAPAGGDGRLTNPFNCYTGSSASCFSQTAADDPGDIIFLYSGAHTGGYTLLTGQKLIGQDASDTLANLGGLTVPTGSDPLPATGGASPIINTANFNAVPLSRGNLLRGFTGGNTDTGTKDFGASLGILTADNNTTTAASSTTTGGRTTTAVAPVINGAGGAVTVNVGTLAPGDSVTITFQVVVDNPFMGAFPQVSNQGAVSYGPGSLSTLTDDPDVGGAADPTVTPINTAKVRINDAKQAEPTSGTRDMVFTVALTSPASGNVTVDFTTQNEPAGSGKAVAGACGSGGDYAPTSGQVSFTAGQQVKTINVPVCADATVEPDETFLVKLTNPVGASILDGQATGAITAANPAGTLIISELRTSGPAGAGDDFVELYNNTAAPMNVSGYGVFKMGADCNAAPVLIATIPNGTVIPVRGHRLLVGSAYSLANYGGAGAAAGDQTLTSDIENDASVAVFSTADVNNLSTAARLDAVGFGTNTGGVCDLLREDANLPAVSGSTTEHSFFRKECDFVGSGCTVSASPKDTNNNSVDFHFADTAMSNISGITRRLGAPGPQKSTSPIRRDDTGVIALILDGTKTTAAVPNRDRDFVNAGPNAPNGTLYFRRRIQNTTASTITRMRFRIIEMTTGPTPPVGTADFRALTSSPVTLSGITDPATCASTGTPATVPCTATAQAIVLETPPAQANGGGYNSTLSVSIPGGLAPNASINVNFALGVVQGGTFRCFFTVEALP